MTVNIDKIRRAGGESFSYQKRTLQYYLLQHLAQKRDTEHYNLARKGWLTFNLRGMIGYSHAGDVDCALNIQITWCG